MKKTRRLILSREWLRNLTPCQLGRALGGEPNNGSFNELCDTLDIACDTLTGANLTTNLMTNTLTNTITNVITDGC